MGIPPSINLNKLPILQYPLLFLHFLTLIFWATITFLIQLPLFLDLASAGGKVIAKKINSSDAPLGSPAGQASKTSPGAVAWPHLQSQTGTTGSIKTVYRTSTAGGMEAATCVHQPAAFTVEVPL